MATTNGSFHHQEQYKPSDTYTTSTETTEQTTSTSTNHDLSKDEVGWYFVEQYYTTLSKSPEKLHLFYGKRSQFVFGSEAEVANVSVGRQAIQERIKQLDFQECKVRVSNVDSLSSFDNIVIQVIGETSNKKSEEPKKFVQSFVLAKQPTGYFVLNDIWRYISDDEEEQAEVAPQEEVSAEPAADAQTAAASAPTAKEEETAEPAKVDVETAAVSSIPEPDEVDKKLEEVVKAKETEESAEAAKEAEEAQPKEEEKAEEIAPEETKETVAEQAAEEADKEEEKPREPAPTPAAKAPVAAPVAAPAPAPAAEPEKPAKPMSWASRVAAAAGPRPPVALPKTATPPAATQARAPVPAAAPKPAPVPQRTEPVPAAPAQETSSQTGNEWQTAGSDSKRQNRPQSMVGAPSDKDNTLGYVKYVTEKVQEAELRAALTRFGGLTYFDINREKNCAFVEFSTPEGYRAAVNANPHVINGENTYLEQRRPKSTAYGGAQYSANRGGASGRGRGRYDGTRAGSQGGPKPFGSQGRGRGGGAPRGKGTSQPANA